MKTILIIICIIFSFTSIIAQESLNQTDSNHLKQGKWIGKYPDGAIRYEGFFKNDKPVGQWKRYHENGKLKAILVYIPNSDKVKAELFDPEGSPVSKGNFTGILKDSVWMYYDNKLIIARENYIKGLKNGRSVSYYPDGKTLNEIEWVNGKLNGMWCEYYPSGGKKSETIYQDGKRQGPYRYYSESGLLQIDGGYNNDQDAGEWKFFNPDGTLKFQLEYKDGILQNPEALDNIQMNEFKAFDKAKGKIKDPEHYIERPDEYFRK